MKHHIYKISKLVLPLLIGLFMVWSLTRKVDWPIVLEEIGKGIEWQWVAISIAFALASHIIRAVRWRMQLCALGIEPGYHDLFVSVFGNYGLNLALPRVGEIWRCSYVAHRYNLPFSTTVGTMVSERMVDMLVAGFMTALAFFHERHHFMTFLAGSNLGQKFSNVASSPVLWGVIAAVLLVALVSVMLIRKTRLWTFATGFIRNVWIGIKGLKDVPDLWIYLSWSIFLWLCYYLNSYTCCFFFGFTQHLDAWAGLAIFVMGSLSLVLPVQGGLGPWHYAVATALLCYAIGEQITDPHIQAFIWVSWSIEQGFVLLLGLYAMIVVALRRNS